jgi:squalene-associated FAD-dependent desaturase
VVGRSPRTAAGALAGSGGASHRTAASRADEGVRPTSAALVDVIVIGGGLAGLAAAAALGGEGHRVRLLEARPFLGGRATSYQTGGETIDNCQHVLLRCCVNLLDFYSRMGVAGDIVFYREFYFIEPGGRLSVLRRSLPSFLGLGFLNLSEKLAVARALLAIRREHLTRSDLERITMQQWLEEKRQPARAIERFWRQVLVSAINEDLDRMAAVHAFQVFLKGFLSNPEFYQMGVPAVPLAQLYASEAWKKLTNESGHVEILPRTPAHSVMVENGAVRGLATAGGELRADFYVSAVPFDRVCALAPDLALDLSAFEHSPITGIHLWFDRPITDLPHATLLDRTIQWMFNKSGGRYIELVVSASRSLVETKREDVIALALHELAEFFPAVKQASLEKSHVVKEIRATFSAKPGLEAQRPRSSTSIRNLFLAGDWTRSGWPATMEGAVRSGYLAAEAVASAAGAPRKFLLS